MGSRLHDAGGECVRLTGSARANEAAGNVIARCGRVRFNLARGAKNGEAVYIGTAPEQAGGRPDRSDGNRVHHNRIAATAECVDIKEASRRNLVERNRCSGSDDPDGAGFSSRGDHTTLRYNRSTHHAGAGIRLGGDGRAQGVRNNVVGNTLTDNAGYGLKIMRRPQGRIVGNGSTWPGHRSAWSRATPSGQTARRRSRSRSGQRQGVLQREPGRGEPSAGESSGRGAPNRVSEQGGSLYPLG